MSFEISPELEQQILKKKEIPLLLGSTQKVYLKLAKEGWFIYRGGKDNIEFFFPSADKSTIWNKIERHVSASAREILLLFQKSQQLIAKDIEAANFIAQREDMYRACIELLEKQTHAE
ncbi:MAG: hypothetical protein KDK41_01040 [Leptospiraceae bacterium]|nr:hypothetical protein [Leptospiraceae bacterium]